MEVSQGWPHASPTHHGHAGGQVPHRQYPFAVDNHVSGPLGFSSGWKGWPSFTPRGRQGRGYLWGQNAQGLHSPITQAGSPLGPAAVGPDASGPLPEPHLPPEDAQGASAQGCELRAFLWPLSPQLQQMKETRRLYPDKSVYTQQIGPGLCFGALALMLRFFFEVPGGGLGSSPPTRAPVSRSAPACLAGC